MTKDITHLSKFLSLVLRHKPEQIGLTLDENGWADVEELIEKVNRHAMQLDREMLKYAVESNNKRRFAFNESKTKILANQGHNIDVDLGLEPVQPPGLLYHGTPKTNLDSIRKSGLMKRGR